MRHLKSLKRKLTLLIGAFLLIPLAANCQTDSTKLLQVESNLCRQLQNPKVRFTVLNIIDKYPIIKAERDTCNAIQCRTEDALYKERSDNAILQSVVDKTIEEGIGQAQKSNVRLKNNKDPVIITQNIGDALAKKQNRKYNWRLIAITAVSISILFHILKI